MDNKNIYELLEVEIEKICRLCLTICDKMTSIFNTFSNESGVIQINEMISSLSGIMVCLSVLKVDCVNILVDT